MLDIDCGDISKNVEGVIDDCHAGEAFITHQSESVGQGLVATRIVSSKCMMTLCFGRSDFMLSLTAVRIVQELT